MVDTSLAAKNLILCGQSFYMQVLFLDFIMLSIQRHEINTASFLDRLLLKKMICDNYGSYNPIVDYLSEVLMNSNAQRIKI